MDTVTIDRIGTGAARRSDIDVVVGASKLVRDADGLDELMAESLESA
jgi:hypothetical protein